MSIFYDVVAEHELDDAHKIELQGYPEEEAGSLETFRYRQARAPELFLGAYLPANPSSSTGRTRNLIGYVCSTLSPDTTLTHASMSTHAPGAPSVCIHSVCVVPAHRRQPAHVGLGLLKEYIARLSASRKKFGSDGESYAYERVLLIAHEELRGFYERAGFEWVGLSAVVHGARPWFEMRKALRAPANSESSLDTSTPQQQAPAQTHTHSQHQSQTVDAATHTQAQSAARPQAYTDAEPPTGAGSSGPVQTQDAPAGLWEALQRASTRPRTAGRLLSSFQHAVQDVTSDIGAEPEAGAFGSPTNKFDLLCPRPGCGSFILKADVAHWVERASVRLDPPDTANTLPEYLGVIPAPPATAQWWLVIPNAMAFENIGFSRPVQSAGPSGNKMKLLACAECDLGPVGWCEEGGTEFWLACNRVGYRA